MKSVEKSPVEPAQDVRTLARTLIGRQAIRLLTDLEGFIISLPKEHYRSAPGESSQSSIGKHVRHCLDHFDSIRSGLIHGVVDYDQRSRDEETETRPEKALARIAGLQSWLTESLTDTNRSIEVRAMTDVEIGRDRVAKIWSSIDRELHFVTSHLTHHMGIIRILAGLFGVKVWDEFGKAVSTQVYERQGS